MVHKSYSGEENVFCRPFRLIHNLCIFVDLWELLDYWIFLSLYIFKSCELIRYLAIAVMRWSPPPPYV